MVQSIDSNSNKPNYNAVKINIKKPEINAGNNMPTSVVNSNGIYNAVNIEIDNPTVNTEPKQVYNYPEAEGIVTYEMTNINQIPLPAGFPIAYHTTNVILPKIENEIELESAELSDAENDSEISAKSEETEDVEEIEDTAEDSAATAPEETEPGPAAPANTVEVQEPDKTPDTLNEEIKAEDKNNTELSLPEEANTKQQTATEIPAPNYTTTEAEKGVQQDLTTNKLSDIPADNKLNITNDVKIAEAETKTPLKKPEIIPGDEIVPEVDIPLIISNLRSDDFDVQAQQMEEIARISLDNQENAVPYIVRDVFSNLIDISKKDTTNLAAPTEEQVNARKKLIANFIAIENSKAQTPSELKIPYQLTEQEFALANELSPMEMAERNKEYALYTISILTKVYVDEVQKQTGNIVPFTDLPGSAAIVDALRYSPNAGVKIAAIDALRHIQRPEYNNELSTLYSLAKVDPNPQVAMAADLALNRTERQ